MSEILGKIGEDIQNGNILVESEEIFKQNEDDKIKNQIEELEKFKENLFKNVNSYIEFFTNKMTFYFTDDKKLINILINYFKTECNWKYQEAIYIKGLVEELSKLKFETIVVNKEIIYDNGEDTISENTNSSKPGYYLNNKLIETINYFLNKVEGKGLYTHSNTMNFEKFVKIFELTQTTLKLTEPYKKGVQRIEKEFIGEIDYRLQSLQHEVSIDGMPEIPSLDSVLPPFYLKVDTLYTTKQDLVATQTEN